MNRKSKKRHFYVAYGNVIRYAEATSMAHAAELAYGLVDDKRMTVTELPKAPRYLPQYRKKEIQDSLAKRHHEKTGSVLSGYERQYQPRTENDK